MRTEIDFEKLFDKDFRERVLALLLDREWMGRYGSQGLVSPEYFDNPEERGFINTVNMFFSTYRRSPDEDEMLALTETDEEEDLVRRVFQGAEEWDLDFVEENVLSFAKQQAMKLAILASVEDIQDGNLSRPMKRVKEALRVGVSLSDMGLWLKRDVHKWVFQEVYEDKIPTGIHHLDVMLDGGLARKELGVILAAPNAGKTMGLVQFGLGATGILARHNVLHVTLELSDTKTAKRYGARTTFRWLKRDDDPQAYIRDFKRQSGVLMPGEIIIKEFAPGKIGVEEIDAFIETLGFMDYRVDLLIVDYPDEMRMGKSNDRNNLQLGNIYTDLRGIAVDKNLAIWAASQTIRSALNKEVVDLDDFAEAYMKAAKADVVLAHCQTKEEEEEGIMRYFAAKIRDGQKGWMVRCRVHKNSHALISTDILTINDLKALKVEREASVKTQRNGKHPVPAEE